MFDDKRSKKVLLIAHCVLNQNAKLDRCAHYPGAMVEVAELLVSAGIGMAQMPCPELLYLGLDRQVDRASQPTVEAEDTRIAALMAAEEGQAFCRTLAAPLVYQIEEYRRNGFEVIGIVGINGSPTCGVETTWADDEEKAGPGVFVRILIDELAARGVSLPCRGIKAYRSQEAVEAVKSLLG